MKYLLLIKDSKGETHLVEVSGNMEIEVAPGDDIVVMDEDGQPVEVSLRPSEEDLLVEFPDETLLTLKDFYTFGDWSNPVTISLNPVDPQEAEYEFNSQTGNLPEARGFSLMRFSSVDNIEFVDAIDRIDLGSARRSSGGGDPEPINLPPDAEDDLGETEQGAAVLIDVLSNDSDPDGGDQLTISGVDQPALGSAVVNSSNQIVFDPGSDFDYLDEGESATVTFTYSISDGKGGGDSATVTVTVNGLEDETETQPDSSVTDEETPVVIDVLANDFDPDTNDGPLSITSITQPALGSVVTDGSTVTFDPGTDFQGLAAGESATVTFTYTTSTGETENATVTINGANDGPDAVDDAAVTSQNSPITIDAIANDTDPDTSDSLVITGVNQPARGSVSLNINQLVFNPGNDFDDLDSGESATVTFDYSITDGNGGTDTATVTVTVNGADDATVTNPDSDVTDEDTVVTTDALSNDSDVDTSDNPLTIASVTQPALGSVTNNGSDVTFNPGSDFQYLAEGESATVTYTYTTDTGVTENVTVTVNGVNDGPDAVDDDSTTDQGTPLSIDVLANDTDPDTNDNLIVLGVDQPAKGFVSIANGNRVIFDPNGEFDELGAGESATVTFDYVIYDGSGGTDTATVTVTVNGMDDATVTNPDRDITDENTPVTIDLLANDSDLDASDNPLTIVSVTQPGLGSVTNNGTDVTFDPGTDFDYLAAGENATVTFTYTTDTGVTENVTVTVDGLNDGPDALDDASVTDQDNPVIIDAIANDTDPDVSDNLVITGVNQPVKGSVSLNSNQLVFDPDGEFDDLDAGESATVTFDYSISDGNGGTDTATVTLTVNGIDDATVTNPDADITDENTAVTIDVLANDSDVDTNDNPLTIASVTQPALGSVANNGTDVTFDPGADFDYLAVGESSTVTFTYTTDTGVTENVTVTVNGVNDGPEAVNDMAVTGQDNPVTIDAVANDTDPDTSDNLIITGVNQPLKGSVSLNSNQLVFDPDGEFNDLGAGESATVTFDYSISDGNGGTDTATVTVTVNGADNPTNTTPDSAVTDENVPVVMDVLGNDSDPDASDNPLSVASVTQPASGSVAITNAGADVTFDPGADFDYLAVGENATVTFTYTTNTGTTENATVTVNGTNDVPTAADDSGSTGENASVIIDALHNDVDPDISDALIITGVDQPSRGSVTINSDSELVFDPENDFDDLDVGESATVTFDYSISDGNGGTDTATVTVTVNGAEDPTDTDPDIAVTDEETSIQIDVLANDSDLDASDNPLTITSVTQPALGVVVNNGTDVTFDPNGQFEGLGVGDSATETFTYTTDTGVTENVTVTVNGVNDAPTAIDDSATTGQGTPLMIDVLDNDSDLDGDFITVVGVTQPALGSASYNSGDVTFDPGSDFDYLDVGESATATFDYTISDGNGGTDTATVTVTINGSEDATVTTPDSAVTNENTPVVVDVLANDSDVDSNDAPLGVVGVTQPGAGSVAITNGGADVTFDPGTDFDYLAAGESTVVGFTYTTDTGATENATVTVNGVNDGPTAVDDFTTTSENSTVVIDAKVNDTDPDATDMLFVAGADQPALGSVSINSDNEIAFDPGTDFDFLDAGESATTTFDYTISDGNGGTDIATVTVTVTGADDATVTNPDADVTDEETPVTIDVLANDTDVDTSDNPLSVASISQPTDGNDGSVANNGTNVTFTPGSNFNSLAVGESATTSFTYTTDTGITENVTVTVNGTNDGPDAVDDTGSTDQNSDINISVLVNDSDPDTSDSLTVSGVTAPSKGAVSILSGTQINFDPNGDFDDLDAGESATVTFDYTIDDGNGGTDTASVTVTVNGTDDALSAVADSATTDEETSVAVNVLTNDVDVDTTDNPLAIDSFTQPSAGNGSVSQLGNALVFDPGSDFQDLAVGETATVTFNYTVGNQDGATDTETVTITVNGVNDGPNAVDDAESVTQNGVTNIDLLGAGDSASADSDPDGDTLTVSQIDGKIAGGTVTLTSGATLTLLNDGTADYDSNGIFDYLDLGESATDSFDYVISDGNGGTDTATVTVTVTGLDDDLDSNPDTATTSETSQVTIDVLANDADPDTSDMPLSVLSANQPPRGSVVNNGTNVTFDPGSDFDDLGVGESATTSFTYTAQNQDGATVVDTVTVTVTGANDGPDTHQDTLHTMEGVGGAVDVIQNDSDIDSDQLTITAINGMSVTATQAVALSSGGFVTVMEDGRVYFNPNGEYSSLEFGETAMESFTYTVEDDYGATAVETVTVVIDGVDGDVQTAGAYQVLSNQLYEIQVDPSDESVRYVPIGDPLPFNFNSIAFNANDNLIYANARGSDTDLGISNDDVFQINPFTGEIVGNLGQFTNDQGESVPSFAGVINADLNVYYVNGPADSSGNTAYAIDLDTLAVTPIGVLPGADFGVDVNTGLIWSVSGTESHSLDPTSGTLTTYTHGGLQEDGVSPADGAYGSMFSDVDGNIQVTSNAGYGLFQLNTATGGLTRIGDAPPTTSNDATGTRTSALPSALPYLFLDIDGSTNASNTQDAFQNYDPAGPPVTIADSDVRIADLDGDTISSARVVLKNSFGGDTLGISGSLPSGITSAIANEGGYQVLTLSGDASQTDYESAIASLTFSNTSPGSTPTDPREISITLTDVEGVEGNTATAFVFIGGGSATISARNVQSGDQSYPDQIVLHEDDFDPATGGATFNLIENDSDEPLAINSITQPPIGQGTVVNNGDGTVTFRPGNDFQFLSIGETAVTTFTYTTDTGETDTVTVTVHGADDPIEATSDSATTDEDSAITIDVLANDNDVDLGDQPLVLTAVTQPALGMVTIVANQVVFDPGTDFDYLNNGESTSVDFIYTVTNADGVDENELVTVTVQGTNSVTPIVVDVDGDGVEFNGVDEGIDIDVDGDGIEERAAWANEDDAVLIYDENNNDQVDGRSEFAFADYSDDPDATDLEGLRHFDSNEDLILDANDAEFDAFKLWQDRDGDGEVGEGEMLTLSEAGIESIGLTSDGNSYEAVGGDVIVHGEGSVNYTDGSVGKLADAEFRYTELTEESELQVVTDNGEIMDVNDSGVVPESVSADLLEGASEEPSGDSEGNGFEGGAAPTGSGDDDAAAADAAMA